MTKSSNKSKRITAKFPVMEENETPLSADAIEGLDGADVAPDAVDAEDAAGPRVTRELEAMHLTDAADAADAADASEIGPSAEMSGPVLATASAADRAMDDATDDVNDEDLEATTLRSAIEPPPPPQPERPRTLAAITRPRGSTDPQGAPPPPEFPARQSHEHADDEVIGGIGSIADETDGIPDETEGAGRGENEWAIADQETIALSRGSVLGARPNFLETDGEVASWPPRHAAELPAAGSQPEAAASLRRRAIPRLDRTGQQRYASPDGRRIPNTPPGGVPRSALPDPRMSRYQELRGRRDAVEQGERSVDDEHHVTERVRQWWGDLRPGLKRALDYQHEARASGVHPIPAGEATPTSRLGDVFGRLTASARELTGRAQSAAAPRFKKLHDQAEQAAHAIVDRFDNDTARQQAPFLGPGRIAVFFRSGVSVGQAQRLLSSNEARPLRLIPRKHGFLAYVLPGMEEQISTRLRVHPYVRDVLYIAMDAYGDPVHDNSR